MLHGHGGEIYAIAREMGISPDSLSDFSSNVSPLPLPSGLAELLAESIPQIRHLPEVDSLGIRAALAERFCMRPENFLVSGGTTEWIYSLPQVFDVSEAVIPLPTYADYMDAAANAGVPVKKVKVWPPPANADTVLEALSKATAGSTDTRSMVFLCNPNNPTGLFIEPDRIAEAASAGTNVIWVVDESYTPFIAKDRESSMLSRPLPPNCLVLRSFSKIFGIPGLRLGYAAANRDMIKTLSRAARPWQVSRLAQTAGEWLAKDTKYEAAVREFCQREKKFFLNSLKNSPLLEYIPGTTHFMLFRLRGNTKAVTLCLHLRQKRLLVRNCENFQGLNDGEYVRISLRSREENMRLLSELRDFQA